MTNGAVVSMPWKPKQVGDMAAVQYGSACTVQGEVIYVLGDGQVVLDQSHPFWSGEPAVGFPN